MPASTFKKDFSYVQSYIRTTPSARLKYDFAIERNLSWPHLV